MGWGGLRLKKLLAEEVEQWLHAHARSADVIRTEELLGELAVGGVLSNDSSGRE